MMEDMVDHSPPVPFVGGIDTDRRFLRDECQSSHKGRTLGR